VQPHVKYFLERLCSSNQLDIHFSANSWCGFWSVMMDWWLIHCWFWFWRNACWLLRRHGVSTNRFAVGPHPWQWHYPHKAWPSQCSFPALSNKSVIDCNHWIFAGIPILSTNKARTFHCQLYNQRAHDTTATNSMCTAVFTISPNNWKCDHSLCSTLPWLIATCRPNLISSLTPWYWVQVLYPKIP